MEENGRKRKKRSAILTAIVLLFLLACLLFIWWAKHVSRPADTAHEALGTEEMLSDSSTQAVEKRRDGVGDSTAVVDSGDVAVVDSSGEQSTEREGSEVATPLEPSFVDSGADDADTVGMVASVDSAAQVAPDAADTGTIAAIFGSDEGAGGCYGDTLAPWVYPDPSGGLHRGSVEVEFVANEPCSVFWRSEGEDEWRYHRGAPLSIDSTATIEYTATDTCGNRMDTKAEYYEVKRSKPSGRCPERMALVEIGSTVFCIDRYEWPNRKGVKPAAYVSIYQAMDSCLSVGKRLCTTDEWKLACSGPYGWSYPYGDRFEPRACVTQGGERLRSGKKPECRGYFEVYDMSGNLLEWTATRSTEDSRFFNVMGGFWESGSQSGCFDIRYSYFPQNRHNPVGFRCCADATPENGRAGTGR